MQVFYGLSENRYSLSDHHMAGGGEGKIYEISEHPELVAKIFRESKRTAWREEKLRNMVRIRLSDEELEQITWPVDLLYSEQGFVGYVMPRLKKNKSISHIYSVNGQDQDYVKRIGIAYNLCEAVRTVHSLGQVCGDLNPQNICVEENTGLVTLVDTDSFHFYAGESGHIYRCEVGLAEYLAPEIQNKLRDNMDLKSAPLPTYTQETDCFALAVHIFTLLMNGCHPFACAILQNGQVEYTMAQMGDISQASVTCPQPIDNIRQGFFPFHQKRANITHPLYAPSFDFLPDYLQKLFVRSFEDGFLEPSCRVRPEEWQEALKCFMQNIDLFRCTEGHRYFAMHAMQCPWCDIERRMRFVTSSVEVAPGEQETQGEWEKRISDEERKQKKHREKKAGKKAKKKSKKKKKWGKEEQDNRTGWVMLAVEAAFILLMHFIVFPFLNFLIQYIRHM